MLPPRPRSSRKTGFVTPQGPIYGRESIEKYYADLFQRVHYSNFINKNDQNSPHVIGTAGNEVWSNGEWGATIQVARTAVLYKSRGTGQILLFVRAILGRNGW